ncbi:hypothetical protein [Schaalia sp. JY-X169]|uniref:hypothetical protein n=1 Tax=Schaalia sp. JY-X169 TaxID=2758572 RepID=UPI0015F3BE48|nr:hypothetical protein [Schaalia sp. JY-X169]
METAYNAMEVAELRRDSLYGSVQTAVQGILDQMVTSCAACDESCRVSLYCFDTEANEFVMLGRSSKDAKHREIGRGRYPAGIGYIGYAWEEGPRAAYRRWPRDPEDWVRKAAGESDVRVNDTAVLPVQVAQHIAFKARSAVYERVDYNGTRIGMLVVESLKPDEATNAKVGPLLESDLGRVLGQIVFLAQDEFVSAHRRTASGLEASD